ncbi:hypothetical protein GQ54DRAFT_298727 [Martensiomyces pterosporus]|nr:hypothetical protein GQ54DRAFT_298727 [Martensiomyces pterosporus]
MPSPACLALSMMPKTSTLLLTACPSDTSYSLYPYLFQVLARQQVACFEVCRDPYWAAFSVWAVQVLVARSIKGLHYGS